MAAIPFALFACFDNNWRSGDAAPVLVAAWIAAYVAFSTKCRMCVLGVGLPFIIFIFCALVGHMVGTLYRFVKHRDLNPIWRP